MRRVRRLHRTAVKAGNYFAAMSVCFSLVAIPSTIAAEKIQKLPLVYSAFAGGYEPVWIAAEEHLGRKYGLDLDPIYAGRARPQQLLLSGDALYVVNSGTGIVSSHVQGVRDFVIIASFIASTGTSIFSVRDIKTVQELRGKNVGVGRPGSITDILARYILKWKLGLEPNRDTKVLPLGEPGNILPALERGVIQAAVLTTPARLLAKKMNFRELLDADTLGIKYPYVGISTLRSTVKKNPELAAKVVEMLTEAIHIYKTEKQVSLGIMRKYLRGASEEILMDTYDYFSARSEKLPYPTLDGVRAVLDMLSDQDPQAKGVNPNEIVDMSLVKALEDKGFIKRLYK